MEKKGALFVCLGNICRSPIAEACFKSLVAERGVADEWFVDSAATSGHEAGSPPDSRGADLMKKNGIYKYVSNHRARKITKKDYETFDYIFFMDNSNQRDVKRMAPKTTKGKLLMLASFDDNASPNSVIEDPYYGGSEGFENVYQQCKRSCNNFLDSL